MVKDSRLIGQKRGRAAGTGRINRDRNEHTRLNRALGELTGTEMSILG